ncbi:MAG: hypothetical protein H6R07_1219 [Proteobacteria bacterium]|nr:hypothetical protein [Pseudomonadota bacterium]
MNTDTPIPGKPTSNQYALPARISKPVFGN